MAKQKNDVALMANIKRKIGNLYITKNEFNTALEYFNESLETDNLQSIECSFKKVPASDIDKTIKDIKELYDI